MLYVKVLYVNFGGTSRFTNIGLGEERCVSCGSYLSTYTYLT